MGSVRLETMRAQSRLGFYLWTAGKLPGAGHNYSRFGYVTSSNVKVPVCPSQLPAGAELSPRAFSLV